MKWINYHHLIYFRQIAELGSISKASKVLMVGQPALSSQLKSLEQSLGVELFERKNRTLILTSAGRAVLEYANKIHNLGQELVGVVEDGILTNEIRLNVGALDSIPKHLISNIVDLAHKKTGCFLSIYEDTIDSLLRQLLAHNLEVLITDQEVTGLRDENIFCKEILTISVEAYAHPKFKHLRKNFPYSLDGVACIVPTSHSKIRNDIENYFHLYGIHPRFIAETQDTSLQKILATKGDGVVFLPKFTTRDLVKSKSLINIGNLVEVNSSFYLVYGKKLIENPALDFILEQDFSKMGPGKS